MGGWTDRQRPPYEQFNNHLSMTQNQVHTRKDNHDQYNDSVNDKVQNNSCNNNDLCNIIIEIKGWQSIKKTLKSKLLLSLVSVDGLIVTYGYL